MPTSEFIPWHIPPVVLLIAMVIIVVAGLAFIERNIWHTIAKRDKYFYSAIAILYFFRPVGAVFLASPRWLDTVGACVAAFATFTVVLASGSGWWRTLRQRMHPALLAENTRDVLAGLGSVKQ